MSQSLYLLLSIPPSQTEKREEKKKAGIAWQFKSSQGGLSKLEDAGAWSDREKNGATQMAVEL